MLTYIMDLIVDLLFFRFTIDCIIFEEGLEYAGYNSHVLPYIFIILEVVLISILYHKPSQVLSIMKIFD